MLTKPVQKLIVKCKLFLQGPICWEPYHLVLKFWLFSVFRCISWSIFIGQRLQRPESVKNSLVDFIRTWWEANCIFVQDLCWSCNHVRVQIWAPIGLPWDANPSLASMQPSQWFDFCSRSMTMRIYFFKSFLWGWRYSFDLKTQHIYMYVHICT